MAQGAEDVGTGGLSAADAHAAAPPSPFASIAAPRPLAPGSRTWDALAGAPVSPRSFGLVPSQASGAIDALTMEGVDGAGERPPSPAMSLASLASILDDNREELRWGGPALSW